MQCDEFRKRDIKGHVKTVPFKVRIAFFLPAKSCQFLHAMTIFQLHTLVGPTFISHMACSIH